ncbi:MAG: PEP-CTERM sorting domain-containing protein [Candidatus Solibacter sp.]|nr:PEP-CTERM sorting domain-containing protein [Candidatus Solibacter sp.]
MRTLTIATVTALLGVGSLCADVIVYDNGGPDHAFHSGSEITHFIQSDDFVFASNTVIHDVHFYALDPTVSVYQGSIAWSIAVDDGAGAPGSVSAFGSAVAGLASTGFSVGGRTEKLVSFIIPDFAALAGQVYWLELHNGPTTTSANLGFLWETTATGAGTTGAEKVLPGGTTWEDNSLEHAFYLTAADPTSTVPEPGSVVLLVTVVGLVGLRSQRRRQCS